jgi:hypothetical protein
MSLAEIAHFKKNSVFIDDKLTSFDCKRGILTKWVVSRFSHMAMKIEMTSEQVDGMEAHIWRNFTLNPI